MLSLRIKPLCKLQMFWHLHLCSIKSVGNCLKIHLLNRCPNVCRLIGGDIAVILFWRKPGVQPSSPVQALITSPNNEHLSGYLRHVQFRSGQFNWGTGGSLYIHILGNLPCARKVPGFSHYTVCSWTLAYFKTVCLLLFNPPILPK